MTSLVATKGEYPVYVHFNRKLLLMTNLGGSISAVREEKWGLTRTNRFNIPESFAAARRQPSLNSNSLFRKPRPTMIIPFKNYSLVPDVGSGAIHLFKIDKRTGFISFVSRTNVGASDGPRHAVVHKKSGVVYVVNQMALTISTMSLVGNKLRLLATTQLTNLPKWKRRNVYAAAIRVSTDCRFVYASVIYAGRKNGQIVGFKLNPKTGAIQGKAMRSSTHGVHPRDFIIMERLQFGGKCAASAIVVANRDSNNVVVIRRNVQSGELSKNVISKTTVQTPTSVVRYY